MRVWISEDVDPENRAGNYGLIARMPPEAGVEAMGPQLDRIAQGLDARFDFPEGWDLAADPELIPVREHLLGTVRPALLALLGATALILLIASVNVSALMLGQVETRGTELAVRRALGAGRKRLLQQLVVESLVIGVLAGVTGAALAAAGFRFLVRVLPLGALADTARLDWALFWTAIAASVVAAVEALPGVESAGSTQRLPLRGSSDNWGIEVEDRPDLEETTTAFRVVTPEYFRTMGIRVLRGRGLQETDRDPDAEVGAVVINEALARKYFPGVDPLGRRIAFMDRWDRIVGVVENVAEAELTAGPVPARYMVYEQVPFLLPWQTLVLRTAPGLDPASVLDPARQAVQEAAPAVALRELTTLESVFTRSMGPAVQLMALLAVLAALALALGAIGIYGVVSHFVTRRTRDWGIRIALGMRPARVAGQIVGRGGALIAAGLVLGLAAFLALSRLLAGFLHGVGTADPLALGGAAAVLLAAGLLAALVPARRASRVPPAEVLREQ